VKGWGGALVSAATVAVTAAAMREGTLLAMAKAAAAAAAAAGALAPHLQASLQEGQGCGQQLRS